MSNSKKKIFIVEDNPNVVEVFKGMLGEQYDLTIEAGDGKQAVKTYAKLKPDLVFMDIMMPNMHGIDVIKKIKKFDPQAKIIIITAHDGPQLREEAAQQGVKHYIKKPFHREALLASIEAALNSNH